MAPPTAPQSTTTPQTSTTDKLRAKAAMRRAIVQRLVQVIKAAITANNTGTSDDGNDCVSKNKKLRQTFGDQDSALLLCRNNTTTDMDVDDDTDSSAKEDTTKLQEVWCEYTSPDPSVLMIKKDGRVFAKDQAMCLVVRLFIKDLESFVDAWIAKSGPLIEEMKAIMSPCDKRCVILHDADDRKITRVLFCCAAA